MSKRLLSKNIVINIILQVTTICSGLIIPRLIIKTYGSNVNGLISSITQFLSYIALLEGGIGGVIKAVLYKPLLNKDRAALGGILNASNAFFRKIAYVFIGYLFLLAFSFDKISNAGYGWIPTAILVLILGISTLTQYFFGLTYQFFLQADQKIWFTSGVQIVTLWLNIIFSVIMIRLGCRVESVKLVTALIFTLRPLCFNLYVKKKYDIDFDSPPSRESLAQRWDGFGHHIAYFIHSNTDVILLTLFTSVSDVSIYTVYLMIVTGVRGLISSAAAAVEPYIGREIAKGDMDKVKRVFKIYELIMFILTTAIFAACAFLIVPFVSLYTEGVTDANYIQPLFGTLLVAAEAVYCLRSPYGAVIFAAGHFKQTRRGAFIEAGINICLSLLLIRPLGIIGVAIGTVVAMLYRTTEYALYLSREIIYSSFFSYIKYMIAAVLCAFLIVSVSSEIMPVINSYMDWILDGVLSTMVSLAITALIFSIISMRRIAELVKYIKKGD